MAQKIIRPDRPPRDKGAAARAGVRLVALRLVLFGALGMPFAQTALAAPPIAAASTPAAAGTQAPAVDIAVVKAAITSDDRRRPLTSIILAQQALSSAALTAEDRAWLRTRLVRDLIRVERTDDAVAQAALGQQEAREERERLHFTRLQMAAWTEARNSEEEVLKLYQPIEARLPALAGDTSDAPARLIAADTWRLAGMAMTRLGRLPEAAELLTRALRILDERPDAVYEFAQALTAMALVHSRSGRVDEALRTVQKAIDISEAAEDRSSLSTHFLRKAHFLGLLGRADEQHEALLKARASAREEQSNYNLAVAATNLADVALQKKNYRSALSYAEEAIPLVERTGDKESLWVCWINKGTALNRLGRPGGIEWIRKAVAAFSAAPGMAANAAEVHGLLAEELAFAHDYPQAYAAAMQFNRLTGQVRKAADQKRITEANAAYEADRRQRQIDALEQEHQYQQRFHWLLALAAVASLIAAVVAAVSRYHVKRAYRAMRDMAFSDPLTGLRNRRHLVSTMHEDLALARRQLAAARDSGASANVDIVFMMIDIDHFKAVNDVHGHAAGDAVLKQCAEVLQRQLRESDTLVRWGGEEFLVVARQANTKECHLLAERLRASIAAHDFMLEDGQSLRKTCSIGYACYPLRRGAEAQPPADWNATVDLADQCLYVAKASGRDLWVGVVDDDARRAHENPGFEELRAGVDRGLWSLRWREGRELTWPPPAGNGR